MSDVVTSVTAPAAASAGPGSDGSLAAAAAAAVASMAACTLCDSRYRSRSPGDSDSDVTSEPRTAGVWWHVRDEREDTGTGESSGNET